MIIATRTLYLANRAQQRYGFDVRIFQPVKEGKSWACRYEIDWPKGTRKSKGFGVDAVQAIILAMHKIGTELYTSSYHAEGNLIFDQPGNGYGFPVPKPLRDQLVGDDAKFEGD